MSQQVKKWIRELDTMIPIIERVVNESPDSDSASREFIPEDLLELRQFLLAGDMEQARRAAAGIGAFLIKTNIKLAGCSEVGPLMKLLDEVDPPTGWVAEMVSRLEAREREKQKRKDNHGESRTEEKH